MNKTCLQSARSSQTMVDTEKASSIILYSRLLTNALRAWGRRDQFQLGKSGKAFEEVAVTLDL